MRKVESSLPFRFCPGSGQLEVGIQLSGNGAVVSSKLRDLGRLGVFDRDSEI